MSTLALEAGPSASTTEAEAPTAPTAARRMPWDGLTTTNMVGNVESEAGLSSVEMLKAAGLDWDVAIRPLWRRLSDGTFKQHPSQREVYRVDNEEPLGSVKSRYEVFGNTEAFVLGDDIAAQGGGKWVVAGQQGNGRRVFMTMKLTEGFSVLDQDPYEMYLVIRTSHGDGTSISASLVPFRMWCFNQNNALIRERKSSWSVPHTTTVSDRIEEARQALKLTTEYTAGFKALAEDLVKVQVSDDKAKQLISSLIPESRARRDGVIEEILNNYHTSETVAPYRGTGYGLWNGLTEYMDHVKVQRNPNARYESITIGEGARTRNQLFDQLLALN